MNPGTAALTIATGGGGGSGGLQSSHAIPTLEDGIPLLIKEVSVTIGRGGFMFNPTSCEPMDVTATVGSSAGSSAAVSSRFQVASCGSLPFHPTLTAITSANSELQGHGASLHMAITTAAGGANLRSLKVDLPQRLPARLGAIQDACPEDVFDANAAACPKASVVGSASVATPILDTPMTGPAYLVSKDGTSGAGSGTHGSSSAKDSTSNGATPAKAAAARPGEASFPDIVLVLQAQGVKIDLTGALYVDEHNITSVTFRSIPDVPIRRLDLVLPEGKRSILAASSGLCTKKPLTMFTAITAQNGAKVKPVVKVGVEGCKKPKEPRHTKKRRAKKTIV